MKLFRGLGRTEYQDVLWAVGLLLDERGYRNFRLVEHEDGIIVQAMPTPDGRQTSHYQTFLLTDSDLEQLMHRAYQHLLSGARRQILRRAYRQHTNFVAMAEADHPPTPPAPGPSEVPPPTPTTAPVERLPAGRPLARPTTSAAAL